MREQKTNALLPSRRLDLVAGLREELGPDQRLAAVVALSGDHGADREHLAQLRELGVDLATVSFSWNPEESLREMHAFAEAVLAPLSTV
jgi:hypothetical protein